MSATPMKFARTASTANARTEYRTQSVSWVLNTSRISGRQRGGDESVGDTEGTRKGSVGHRFASVLQQRTLQMFDSTYLIRSHVKHRQRADA